MVNSKVGQRAKLFTLSFWEKQCQTSWGGYVCADVFTGVLSLWENPTSIAECSVHPKKFSGSRGWEVGRMRSRK